MNVRPYGERDLEAMREIWNAVVKEGNAFPQTEPMTVDEARNFFAGQTYAGVLEEKGELTGLYILHPNNVGRCGHISNASFAVKKSGRGRGAGELLVRDCLEQGHRLGFRLLQFNAVVSVNQRAMRLYEKMGFHRLGSVPGGFRLPDGTFTDIFLYYIELA